MKPLSERDENTSSIVNGLQTWLASRNEATLWKRWELCWNYNRNRFFFFGIVGMKPLSERDENISGTCNRDRFNDRGRNEATLWKRWEPCWIHLQQPSLSWSRNEATLWKRWEHSSVPYETESIKDAVGMKPLSERDENFRISFRLSWNTGLCRNEATLWKRWELLGVPLLIHTVE